MKRPLAERHAVVEVAVGAGKVAVAVKEQPREGLGEEVGCVAGDRGPACARDVHVCVGSVGDGRCSVLGVLSAALAVVLGGTHCVEGSIDVIRSCLFCSADCGCAETSSVRWSRNGNNGDIAPDAEAFCIACCYVYVGGRGVGLWSSSACSGWACWLRDVEDDASLDLAQPRVLRAINPIVTKTFEVDVDTPEARRVDLLEPPQCPDDPDPLSEEGAVLVDGCLVDLNPGDAREDDDDIDLLR